MPQDDGEGALTRGVFDRSYPVASRIASVRAAKTVTRYGLPEDFRRDLEQEALMGLWRRCCGYDPKLSSWRTFSEMVMANLMNSQMRYLCSDRSGVFKEDPIDHFPGLVAPHDSGDLRRDVARVLAGVSAFDRSVALNLVDHSASETSQRLRVSRATVYRAIGRLRVAFTSAGIKSIRACREGC